MRERMEDRRRSRAQFFSPAHDRRRRHYDRRGERAGAAMAGMVRPGWAEAMPRRERRRLPGSGWE